MCVHVWCDIDVPFRTEGLRSLIFSTLAIYESLHDAACRREKLLWPRQRAVQIYRGNCWDSCVELKDDVLRSLWLQKAPCTAVYGRPGWELLACHLRVLGVLECAEGRL